MIDFFTHFLIRLYQRAFVLLNNRLPLRELCSLVTDGATVDTYSENSLVFRTVIQLDGDVFTIVVRSDSTQALWSVHADNVTSLLTRISSQLNGVVRLLTWPVGVGVFAVLALWGKPISSISVWGFDEWVHLVIINILIPLGVTFLGHMPPLRRAIGRALVRTLPTWLGLHGRRERIEALQSAARGQVRHQAPAL